MQVPVDVAEVVDPVEQRLHLVEDAEGPFGEVGAFAGGGAWPAERVVPGQPLPEGDPRLDGQGEELVFPVPEAAQDGRDAGHSVEGAERLVFLVEAGDGVPAVAVEAGVRAGLLEDRGAAVADPDRPVHAAAVGEVQGAFDDEGLLAAGPGLPRGELGPKERGHLHPVRGVEYRAPQVGDEGPVGPGDGGHGFPVVPGDPLFEESAVAEVEGARLVPEVAEDERAGLTAQEVVERGDGVAQGPFVRRVHGDELPAGLPGGVLGVPREEDVLGAQELQGCAGGQAVLVDDDEDVPGVGQGRRDVDLPALRGHRRARGAEDLPDVAGGDVPVIRW